MVIATGDFHRYEMMSLIGEGAFGQVYKAKDLTTDEIVALKKLKLDMYDNVSQQMPETASREIQILKKLDHPNVIRLKEVVISPDEKTKGIYLVLEYIDHNLDEVAKQSVLVVPLIKYYMKQLLSGLEYCHSNQVLHRDIKGANILVSKKGNLKLADFGQSRCMDVDTYIEDIDLATGSNSEAFNRDYDLRAILGGLTPMVITLNYRPPELLLGSDEYGPEIDMWSAGCVFAQLLKGGSQILPGTDELDQLKRIFELCGTPDEETWPGVSRLCYFDHARKNLPFPMMKSLWETNGRFDQHAIELLDRMLCLDPAKRISAKDALAHSYFTTDPLPCEP